MLRDLRKDGIAVTDWSSLFGDDPLFDELSRRVDEIEAGRQEEIEETRRGLQDPDYLQASNDKTFIIRHVQTPVRHDTLWTRHPQGQDLFASVALRPILVDLVNEYFGLATRLVHYNVWRALPTPTVHTGQLWHRDPEDRRIVKVFLSLRDVTEAEGPLTYAKGSQPGSTSPPNGQAFRPRRGREPRYDDNEMAEVVSPEHWLRATGPAGTLVIADTAGWHKGAARITDRLSYVCSFVSHSVGV